MLVSGRIYGNEFEAIARHYWGTALLLRYHRIPEATDTLGNLDAMAQLDAFEAGQPVTVEMPLPIPFSTGFGQNGYPPEAQRELGSRIDTLDAEWMDYLSHSGLTLQGNQVALIKDGRPEVFLRRFDPGQIGSRDFWRAAQDVKRVQEMVNCIAGRFLGDRGYWIDANSVDLGRCSAAEVTGPNSTLPQ